MRPAPPRLRAEPLAGALALGFSLLHELVRPESGTDLAAQLARASFAKEAPFTPFDLSWYGGVHPYAYSLLTPWLMAVTGVTAAGVIAAVLGAVLFARLLRDLQRPLLVAGLGAFFSVADVVSGRTTFALGAVALLGALLCRERRLWAGVLGVLTALLSPVAAVFLGLCAAVLVLHRRPGGWTLGIAATVPVLVLNVLFRSGGVQPFDLASMLPGVAVALGVALVTASPLVRTGALLYAVAVVGFYLHHDPFGSNVLRLGLLVSAPVALATARPRRDLLALVVVGCLAWQVDPLHGDLTSKRGPSLAALTSELEALHARRVEVVAPRDHQESWRVAERVPLARGWGRQVDEERNPLFYEGRLTATGYLSWLHARGVDHVAQLRHGKPDFGALEEMQLLQQPLAGLTEVWQDQDWTVYAVDAPTPLADPPVAVVRSTRTVLELRAPGRARVHVRLRWSRWLSVQGPACITRIGREVELRVSGAGTIRIGSSLLPEGHC